MVSHELRTPLSTIHMNAQLLARAKDATLPDSLKARVDRLTQATRQMTTLIEGLLEYTRVESGRIHAHPEEVDTYKLAQEVAEAHADSTTPEVQLVLEPPQTQLTSLVSDPRLVRVVLSNLVGNALKFTQKGTVTIRLTSDAHTHSFEVHDTGIGIPEEDLPRVFLPFEQLEPVQRKSIPGVGLGLALVKQLVETLGGRLDVMSQVGTGSTFAVHLPSIPPSHYPQTL